MFRHLKDMAKHSYSTQHYMASQLKLPENHRMRNLNAYRSIDLGEFLRREEHRHGHAHFNRLAVFLRWLENPL